MQNDPLSHIPITTIYERVTDLSAQTHRFGSSYLVRCPCPNHEDRHPSCLLRVDTGVWKCLARHCAAKGGKLGMVIAAGFATTNQEARTWLETALHRDMNLTTQPQLKTRNHHSDRLRDERLVATHVFRNERNEPVYRILRYHGNPARPGDRKKRFDFQRPDGANNVIHHYRPTCKQPACPCHGSGPLAQRSPLLVPYRLDDLARAKSERRMLLLPEGELHADALGELGFLATTNAFGSIYHYPQRWLAYFTGIPAVLVLTDADAAGRLAAAERVQHLRSVVPHVGIVDLQPEGNNGYDILDWLAEHPNADHGTVANILLQHAQKAP